LPFWLPVKPFVQFCKKSTEIHGEGDSPATKTQEILIKQKSFVATELNSMSEEESCVEPHFPPREDSSFLCKISHCSVQMFQAIKARISMKHIWLKANFAFAICGSE
jgi:hypothetical protein